MSGELDKKTPAMIRKGRIFYQMIRALSWSNEIRVQVPDALWKLVKDGWHTGPLVKSMSDIKDPELNGVIWTAWQFQLGAIWCQSNKMTPGDFVNVWVIAREALANPGDTPTDGI